MVNPFSFEYIRSQYEAMLAANYTVMNCRDYVKAKAQGSLPSRIIVNRVDVDVSVRKAERLREIYAALGIPATFFIRLHAKEYNPFDFENYRILKALMTDGHEIGYHSEIIDQAAIWEEDATENLRRDLAIFELMLGTKIDGVASHGGMTGLNNLDFWRDRRAADLGVLYEAYEDGGTFALFNSSLYVTDSEWTRWKAYRNGQRIDGDYRAPADHIRDDGPAVLYLLIHPETYFDRHPYD